MKKYFYFKNLIKSILVFSVVSTIFFTTLISNVYAASGSVSLSGGGTVNTSQNVSVGVSVSATSDYNAVTVNVSFSNLTYVSVSANSQWTAVSGPTRNGNSITFSGAKLGGSYSGLKNVLTVNFKTPGSAGNSSVSANATVALADGNGTQVNAGSKSVSYTVITPPPPPPLAPTVPGLVVVSSTTHPDSNAWYLSKTITMNWGLVPDATGYSYVLDQAEGTVPDNTSEGTDLTKTFNDLPDGISYFHIKAQNSVGWGSSTHFKIQIDTIKPDPFTITEVQDAITLENVIYFATNDELSGISKYTISIDGVDKGEQKTKYILPVGTSSVTVTAYDKAGNVSTSTLELINFSSSSTSSLIKSNEFSTTINSLLNDKLPLVLGIVIAIIILIVGGFLIFRLVRKNQKQNLKDKGNDKMISSN